MGSRPSDWILAAVVALLLCASFPSLSRAADLPSFPVAKAYDARFISCSGTLLSRQYMRGQTLQQLAVNVALQWERQGSGRTPAYAHTFTAAVLPTGSGCPSFYITGANADVIQVFVHEVAVDRGSYALSVAQGAEIAMYAFLLWAAAWGIRVIARVGTSQHD